MKRLSLFVFLSMLCTATFGQGTTGNVNVFLGSKTLDSNYWPSPYDSQGELGVLIDVAGQQWPVSVAIDLLASGRTERTVIGDVTYGTTELDLGVRKVFNLAGTQFHPYVGGGLAFVTATVDLAGWSHSEGGTGLWLNGGFFVTLGQSFNLGLDLRHSSADVDWYGQNIPSGGNHAGILLGYHW